MKLRHSYSETSLSSYSLCSQTVLLVLCSWLRLIALVLHCRVDTAFLSTKYVYLHVCLCVYWMWTLRKMSDLNKEFIKWLSMATQSVRTLPNSTPHCLWCLFPLLLLSDSVFTGQWSDGTASGKGHHRSVCCFWNIQTFLTKQDEEAVWWDALWGDKDVTTVSWDGGPWLVSIRVTWPSTSDLWIQVGHQQHRVDSRRRHLQGDAWRRHQRAWNGCHWQTCQDRKHRRPSAHAFNSSTCFVFVWFKIIFKLSSANKQLPS